MYVLNKYIYVFFNLYFDHNTKVKFDDIMILNLYQDWNESQQSKPVLLQSMTFGFEPNITAYVVCNISVSACIISSLLLITMALPMIICTSSWWSLHNFWIECALVAIENSKPTYNIKIPNTTTNIIDNDAKQTPQRSISIV